MSERDVKGKHQNQQEIYRNISLIIYFIYYIYIFYILYFSKPSLYYNIRDSSKGITSSTPTKTLAGFLHVHSI